MSKNRKGKVFLVGAGPGDPGLLTLRGAEILKSAGVVIYDRLVNPVLLQFAENAQKIFAGKDPSVKKKASSSHPDYFPQEKINALLVRLARQGKTVVRLKGGDPFVFGRGGEEASVLRRAGISFEVVPGVSAAFAVPAYAGIPVTDRRFASSVTLVTAHEGILKEEEQKKWEELARIPGTLVFFMGVKTLSDLVSTLVRKGKSPETPVSVIERGTLPGQRVVEGTLGNIAQKIKKAKIQPPALAVIGEVTRLRKQLDWFRPGHKEQALSGKTVLVTRTGFHSAAFRQALESKGALVRDFPVICILPPKNWKPVDQAVKKIKSFDWIIFTSANGVDAFFKRLAVLRRDSRSLANVRIAVIGESTRERLLEKGIEPELMPRKYTSKDLIAELVRRKEIKGHRFLLPRTDIAPPYLRHELQKRGAHVTQVITYRTARACGPKEKKILQGWLQKGDIDFITFTSASTADHFFALLPKQKHATMTARLVSIGPVTSRAIAQYGARPWREAREHTMKGIVNVISRP